MPDIRVERFSRIYNGDNYAVNAIDLTIENGEFFTLLGPSGCGKSTTLACIAGLDDPTHGRIAIGGQAMFDHSAGVNVPCEERNIGMVFQSYALWPHKTVEENLAVPLVIRDVTKADRARRIGDALAVVDLGHLARRYPHELSGGQQQRVALARALVYSPSVLLLDEPLSNLDARLRHQARAWIKRIQEELRITTVYVTHDQEEALAMSDRVAVMHGGKVIQCGAPKDVYERPATPQVAAFVGRMNFLDGTITAVGRDAISVTLKHSGQSLRVSRRPDMAYDGAQGASVSVAFRPENVGVLAQSEVMDGDVLTGNLAEQAYVGFRYEYKVQHGDAVIEAYGNGPIRTRKCALAIRPEAIHLY